MPDQTRITTEQLEAIRRSNVKNIIARLQSGATLTAAQLGEIVAMATPREAGPDPSAPVLYADTFSDLAAALGWSRQHLTRLRKAAPSAFFRWDNGKWNVQRTAAGLISSGHPPPKMCGTSIPVTSDDGVDQKYSLEVERLQWICRRLAVEFGEAEGRLVPVEDVRAWMGTMIATARSRLLAVPSAVAKLCEGASASEIHDIVDSRIREALESVSELPDSIASSPGAPDGGEAGAAPGRVEAVGAAAEAANVGVGGKEHRGSAPVRNTVPRSVQDQSDSVGAGMVRRGGGA